jgi:hypothetical protein
MKDMLKNKWFILLVVAVVGYVLYVKFYKKDKSETSNATPSPEPTPVPDLPTNPGSNSTINTCMQTISGDQGLSARLVSKCEIAPRPKGEMEPMVMSYYYDQRSGSCKELNYGGGPFNNMDQCRNCCPTRYKR